MKPRCTECHREIESADGVEGVDGTLCAVCAARAAQPEDRYDIVIKPETVDSSGPGPDADTERENAGSGLDVTAGGPPMSAARRSDEDHLLVSGGVMAAPKRPGVIGTIGRFEVLRLLGEGGMGRVVLARDPVTGVKVAIKMLKPELCRDRGLAHRFLSEARYMYRMSHPNILQVMEVSRREDGAYYVVPYVSGGSLAERISPERPLAKGEIVTIARQVALALSYAHKKGIIHRDIKPANIMLGEEGRVLLTDFGLARSVFNDSVVDVRSDCVEGTPAYLSPRAAAGNAEDTRCDIYALGCMLYEMLTGRPPYSGRSADSILKQIQMGPPTPIHEIDPRAPADLVEVAERAMARELRDRYAEIGDMLADLDRIADNKAPHGLGARQRAGVTKRVALYTVGLLALVALVAALALLMTRHKRQGVDDERTGTIAGRAVYAGAQAGALWVVASPSAEVPDQAWDLHSLDMASAVPLRASPADTFVAIADGGAYTLRDLSPERMYWINAFLDVDGDGRRDEWEPAAPAATDPVTAGPDSQNVNLALADSDCALTTIRGRVKYNGALSGAIHVVACVQAQLDPLPNDGAMLRDGLILHYGFDENENDVVTDKSDHCLDGVVYGATWTDEGRIGGAYRLHGPASTITSGGTIGICGSEARTLAFWSKVLVAHAGERGGGVVGWGTCDVDGTRFRVGMWEDGTWLLWGWGLHYDWHIERGVPLTTWQYHTVTYDGKRVRWFIDGEEVGTGFPREYRTIDSPLIIGGAEASIVVDEVMVWRRALPVDQVKRLYAAVGGVVDAPVTVWQHGGVRAGPLAACCRTRRGVACLSAPGAYRLSCLNDASALSVFAYVDVNGDGYRNSWEPWGAYAGNPIGSSNGLSDVSITVAESTIDSDGDGIADFDEIHGAVGTQPWNADSDGDGLPDGWEEANGGRPLVADGDADTDEDGLDNQREYAWGCSGRDADSDDDGVTDSVEVAMGSDPTDASSLTVSVSGTVSYDGGATGRLYVSAVPVGAFRCDDSPSPERLLLDYAFETAAESGDVKDTSASGNHGTVYGAVWSPHARRSVGGAYYFDGWNDWMETPRLALSSNVTLALRFKPHADIQPGSRVWSGYGTPRIEVAVQQELLCVYVWDGADESARVATPYRPGEVCSLVYVYNMTEKRAQLFLNGVCTGVAQAIVPLTGDAECCLIGRYPDGEANWPFFRGRLDRVLMWRRAVSRREIQAIERSAHVYGATVSGPGAYVVGAVPSGRAYFVSAFLDGDGNGLLDAREPVGVYRANPLYVTGSLDRVSFALFDPAAGSPDPIP